MIFHGCGTALVTPFTSSGEVDYQCYKRLVARQLQAGVDFLVPLGSTAETPCLDVDERRRLLDLTLVETGGQIPVLVGVGSNRPEEVLLRIKEYEQLAGVSGFLVVTPYYNKPTQQGLQAYFRLVASATELPIVLYNVPGRTGINLQAMTALKIAELANVVAIKEASGNYSQCSEIIGNAPEDFALLSGDDELTLALMATGARGVISVVSNLVPEWMVEFVHAMENGDWVTARAWHHRLQPLFNGCFVESNPIPVKFAMSRLDLLENYLRLPLVEASKHTEQVMEEVMQHLELL